MPSAWAPLNLGSGPYRHWLCDRGSLTRRLQARCERFTVEDVHQYRAAPGRDERLLLGMRVSEQALLREVRLCCNGVPVVFAHSVLPRASIQGPWQALPHLASRPLGEALFNTPGVVRTPLSYRKLLPGMPLYRRAAAGLVQPPARLWARRSIFTLGRASILVTEVFLPAILKLRHDL